MGCALALIFQVRSLNIPCNMVHFQGSISGSPQSLDYTQKLTKSTLAVKLSVSAIIYPRWTATEPLELLHLQPSEPIASKSVE